MFGFRLADEEAAKPIVVEDYVDEKDDIFNFTQHFQKRKAQRSFSASDRHDSLEDHDAPETMEDIQVEVEELREAMDHYRKENKELRKALERVENILQIEQAANRELEREKMMKNEEILCLQNDLERLRESKNPSLILADHSNILQEDEILQDFADPFVRHSSWSNLAVPSSEQEKRPRRRKTSAPCGPSASRSPSVSKAKTLCFQISFNGMTLMEKTDFGET